MNERIQELAGQAKFIAEETINKKISKNAELDAFAEKFAELIIQKCITQISLIGVSNFENEDIMWTVETAIASIEEHFGVEE